MRNFAVLPFVFVLLQACSDQPEKTMPFATDVHSYAQPNKTRVNHLHWSASVDFDTKIITAIATWTLATPHTDTLVLDTKGLTIEKILLDEKTSTPFELGKEDAILGQPLSIKVEPTTKTVAIYYTTHPDAEAVQWLSPQQTAGKKFPFLFTQSQAILARSWVPCQDSPGIRFTYHADVTVPKDLLAMMSASNPQQKKRSGPLSL
jgi:leukotriene-A4 hydrolase